MSLSRPKKRFLGKWSLQEKRTFYVGKILRFTECLRVGIRICLFSVIWVVTGCSRENPEAAVRRFFLDLAAGHYQQAHEQSAFRFRALQSWEQFGRAVRELGLEEFAGGKWVLEWGDGYRAELEGTYENAAGVRTRLRVELLREAGRWRVAGIRKGGGAGSGEDLFSSIGRGRALNPFVGRSVPSEVELRELVEKELGRLGAAIAGGSFEAFHHGISELWQEQVTPVTLKHVFGQMAGSGYDFSGLKRLRPAYDPVPYVNPGGVLIVEGYYPSKPARLFFGMKFVSESDGWRLLGLEVQLR
jgi:hypothetical protein